MSIRKTLLLISALAFISTSAISAPKTKVAKWSKETAFIVTNDRGGLNDYYE